MLRLLAFLAVLGLAAWGLSWLADNPGTVSLTWRGVAHNVTLMQALGLALAGALAFSLLLALLRFALRAPRLATRAVGRRRQRRGFAALSRGMIAVGAGDAREARRQAREADRLFGGQALTKLLIAQSAQLSGDRAGAVAAFNDMLASDDTQMLGLRGLHVEARRAGQPEVALAYAKRAYERAAPPWAAQAVLDDFSARGDWANALTTVEANAKRGLIDRPTANRWRAVLNTALAAERAERDPKGALVFAREALDLAPGLVPAAALCGRLTAAAGDLRKAARILETAYRAGPHPDLAEAYVRMRAGDSPTDRLARAKTLVRVAPLDPESVLTVARAELEAQDLAAARKTLAPLLQGEGVRPTARACLLMADIEQATADDGAAREWLARAARARRDRAWVGEGIIADRWSPAGPDGALDAFAWRTPVERRSDPPPTITVPPAPPAAPPPPPPAIAKPAEPAPKEAPKPVRRPVGTTSLMPANAPDDPGTHTEFQNLAME
jgi:HemY protein